MAGIAPTPEPEYAPHVANFAAAHQLGEGAPHGHDLRQGQEDEPVFRLDRVDRGSDLKSVNRPLACLDEAERGTRDAARTSGHGTLSVARKRFPPRSQHLNAGEWPHRKWEGVDPLEQNW